MWKADLERDEKGVGDGREDCTSTGLAAGRPSQLLGIGLFHGEAEKKWECWEQYKERHGSGRTPA